MTMPIFRAWSNKYNRMFRVREISQDREGYTHGVVDMETKDEFQPTQEEYKNHPFVWIGRVDFVPSPTGQTSGLCQDPNEEPFYLMQFSGLTGTFQEDYIFEKDIVSYEDEYGDQHTGVVVLEKGAFYFRPISKFKKHDILLNEVNEFCEIIGNVYANQSLLTA